MGDSLLEPPSWLRGGISLSFLYPWPLSFVWLVVVVGGDGQLVQVQMSLWCPGPELDFEAI